MYFGRSKAKPRHFRATVKSSIKPKLSSDFPNAYALELGRRLSQRECVSFRMVDSMDGVYFALFVAYSNIVQMLRGLGVQSDCGGKSIADSKWQQQHTGVDRADEVNGCTLNVFIDSSLVVFFVRKPLYCATS